MKGPEMQPGGGHGRQRRGCRSRRAARCLRLLVAAAAIAGPWPPAARKAAAVVLGVCEPNPVEALRAYQPLVSHLGRKLGESVRLVAVEGPHDADRRFRAGELDVVFTEPLTALAMHELGGGRIELRRWENGKPAVAGVVVALAADGGGADVAGLDGKVVAFDHPWSTFGSSLPKLALAGRGALLVPRVSPADKVRAEAVGYVYAGAPENVVAWVLRGRVAAGALREDLLPAYAGAAVKRLAVVARTRPLPPGLVVVSATADTQGAAAVLQLLEKMADDPQGREILMQVHRTTRFDPLPEDVQASLAALRNFVRSELLE